MLFVDFDHWSSLSAVESFGHCPSNAAFAADQLTGRQTPPRPQNGQIQRVPTNEKPLRTFLCRWGYVRQQITFAGRNSNCLGYLWGREASISSPTMTLYGIMYFLALGERYMVEHPRKCRVVDTRM